MRIISKLSAVLCAFMIFMNGYLPFIRFGNTTVGEVSFFYPNLFQPASITFSIWGVIYIGLVLFHGLEFIHPKESNKAHGGLILIHLLNVLWLVTWQSQRIGLSTAVIFGLLVLLIIVSHEVKQPYARHLLHGYFAWITVASVANMTIYLVKLNSNFLSVLPESVWMVLVLLIVSDITLFTAYIRKSIAYLSVILWAYMGIMINHLITLNGRYINIIITLILISLGAILLMGYLIINTKEGSYGKLE